MADGEEAGIRRDGAVLEDDTSGLFPLGPTLGSDDAFLILHWLPHEDLTVL